MNIRIKINYILTVKKHSSKLETFEIRSDKEEEEERQ